MKIFENAPLMAFICQQIQTTPPRKNLIENCKWMCYIISKSRLIIIVINNGV